MSMSIPILYNVKPFCYTYNTVDIDCKFFPIAGKKLKLQLFDVLSANGPINIVFGLARGRILKSSPVHKVNLTQRRRRGGCVMDLARAAILQAKEKRYVVTPAIYTGNWGCPTNHCHAPFCHPMPPFDPATGGYDRSQPCP